MTGAARCTDCACACDPALHAAQIENTLKFARLLVGLHGRSSKREVQELAAWVVEAGASLHFLEDRLVALSEAAQVCLSVCAWWIVGAARGRCGSGDRLAVS